MDLHREKYKAIEEGRTYVPPQLTQSQIKPEGEAAKEEKKIPMETFDIDESNLKKATENIDIVPSQSSSNQQPSSGLDTLTSIYQSVFTNKSISVILNPFQDDSAGIQLCYKIYCGITCFTILLVILLLICFS